MNYMRIDPEDIPPSKRTYSEARELCEGFMANGWSGMQVFDWQGIEFTDDMSALHSAAVNIRSYIKKNSLPIQVLVRKRNLYLVRKEDT